MEKIERQENREKLEKIFVREDKSEHVHVPHETARKIHDLLASQANVVDQDDITLLLEASDKVAGANCHKTALYLTNKCSREFLFDPNNDKPSTAGHEQVESNTDIYSDIDLFQKDFETRTPPFRISFFKEKDEKMFAFHSITVLGTTNTRTIVGFEKKGPYADTPFSYVDVLKISSAYLTKGYSIGIQSS